MEKLAGDLLLGLKFVKLEILSTSFIDFLYDKFGEIRSTSLGPEGLSVWYLSQSQLKEAIVKADSKVKYLQLIHNRYLSYKWKWSSQFYVWSTCNLSSYK